MKVGAWRNSVIADQRRALQGLARELQKRPLEFLPERSVESLSQFFAGYGIFRSPVSRELSSFERWLKQHLFYPQDTGARWWRFIQLNSEDKSHGYELFFKFYSEYLREEPVDSHPNAEEFRNDPLTFDFHLYLYCIDRKPGLYLGSGDSVHLIAAYLAGYFKGKRDAGLKLTRDEKTFFRFEDWLRHHHKFQKRYPWYRLVEMWPYGTLNSFESFFAYYDAFLTEFGKKPRGLEDIFVIEANEEGTTTIRRRRKAEMPKRPIHIAETQRWWR